MDVMESFRDLIRLRRNNRHSKIPRSIRQNMPKDLMEAAWPDENVLRERYDKPEKRLVTREQIEVASAKARKRLADRFFRMNREVVGEVESRCAQAGLFRTTYRSPLDNSSYFRSVSLKRVKDGDRFPLESGGAVWTGKRWSIFMPVQVASVLDCHLIVAGFLQTPAGGNSRLAVAFGNVLQPCPRYDIPKGERPLAEGSWASLKCAKPEAIRCDGSWTFPHIERHLDKPRFIGRLEPFPFALSI